MPTPRQDDTLLARWLADELTEAEARYLAEQPEVADYERILSATQRLAPPPYDAAAELARFHAARGSATTKTLHPRPRPLLRRLRPWIAIAAGIALLLSVWFFLPAGKTTYVADRGNSLRETLADGSLIRLNAGSELSFRNGDKKRAATLSGEAFFEVEKNNVPFVISTEMGTVTVVGTRFNIYQRAGEFRVACTSGRVRVNFTGRPEAYPLTPGESVAITDANEVLYGPTDTTEELDWLEGRSVFTDRPLAKVIEELARQFDLEFEAPASLDLELSIRTNFPNDDADDALEAVFSAIRSINYVRDGRIVRLSLLTE